MKVNLPHTQVKKVLVDCLLAKDAKNILRELSIEIIETIPLRSIKDSTATHPDMQFVIVDKFKALVCAQVADYYSRLLPEFEIVPVYGIFSPYPNDCLLNITVMNKICFLTKFQKNHLPLPEFLKLIEVRQGYTKCNICILNENTIITSDKSIYKAATENSINVYMLADTQIELKGYDHGFWGGTCGLINDKKLFFCGDITRLDCTKQLLEILSREKIEPIFPKNINLCDNGSIIPLY